MTNIATAPWSDFDQAQYEREIKRRAAKERQRRAAIRKFKKLQPILRAGCVAVHFADEAPRIGSGQRRVFVESIGPQWVHVRSATTGKTGRLSRSCWDRLTA